MRPIATHVLAWSVCVCLYVMGMNPAKMAEPIEMPFGMWAQVGPHNHVLDGGSGFPQGGRGNFGGEHIWPCPWSVYSTRRCDILWNSFDLLL